MKSNEILNTLTRKYDHDRVSKWFKNSKRIQIKFEIYEIRQHLMISYEKVIWKFWMSFEHFFMYDTCFSKHLRWSFVELRKIWLNL
jgi:hypothetical protein